MNAPSMPKQAPVKIQDEFSKIESWSSKTDEDDDEKEEVNKVTTKLVLGSANSLTTPNPSPKPSSSKGFKR